MKNEILNKILSDKVVAVVRLDKYEGAADIIKSIVKGGIRIIEITLTTPGALDLIRELSPDENMIVGAGSVLDIEMARQAVDCGAKFIVSPITNDEVVKYCVENNKAVMPGAFTPTEVKNALKLGAEIIKVFPADNLGMKFFKNILAPMPGLKIMPTGGVTIDNAADWLQIGACAVGIGSALVPKNLENDELLKAVTENAKKLKLNIDSKIKDLEALNG